MEQKKGHYPWRSEPLFQQMAFPLVFPSQNNTEKLVAAKMGIRSALFTSLPLKNWVENPNQTTSDSVIIETNRTTVAVLSWALKFTAESQREEVNKSE